MNLAELTTFVLEFCAEHDVQPHNLDIEVGEDDYFGSPKAGEYEYWPSAQASGRTERDYLKVWVSR